jgi:hypothetical protein
MKVIEITEIEVKAALDVAKSEEVKNVLVALFCKGEKKPTPTLDDYTTIRSYEDACAALKCSPIDEKALHSAGVRKGIIALIKLETISRALWGKKYQPKPDASGNSRFYFPWFALWTEREIKETEDLVYLVYIPVIDALNNRAGFGYARTYHAPSSTNAHVGSRLWQESREKAKYFGQQFIELWFDYLMFNVKKVQE